MEHEANLPVIFDVGSTVVKVGFANQLEPVKFTSLVSYGKNQPDVEPKHIYVGENALAQRPIQIYEYPVQRGLTTNWRYIESMWNYSFKHELSCDPATHPVLLLEHPLTPNSAREKTTQIMFETFKVPALFFSNPCVASLRAVGRASGVAMSMGGQTTYSMAVKDGKGMIETLSTLDIGSQDIAASFLKYMSETHPEYGWTPTYLADQYLVHDIIRHVGYLALDYNAENLKPNHEVSRSYIDYCDCEYIFHHERFKHTEILFKPELHGIEKDGIHHMIYNSVKKCDISIQSELFKNIVLSGGASLIPGLDERLIRELKILSPEHAGHITIVPDPRRNDLPFLGAAMLAQSLTEWMTKAEYDEVGPSLVHEKCPLGLW